MNRISALIVALIVAGSTLFADNPIISVRGDILRPQVEFQIRTAGGSTPIIRDMLFSEGVTYTNMAAITNAVLYYYATNWPATNWVAIPYTAKGSNYLDFACTAGDTATSGVFRVSIIVWTAGSTNQNVWGQGRLTLDYVPPLLYGGVPLNLALGGVEVDPIAGAIASNALTVATNALDRIGKVEAAGYNLRVTNITGNVWGFLLPGE